MSVINTNSLSLIAQGNLAKSQSALGTAIERLSSGLRINSAKDDAAGQAIANRFTANIKGLTQAARNANDGISIAQTTEGALNEINNNLQRIRELSVQAANGTNEASDLNSIQDEINQRLGEINRVSAQTQFNGVNVLGKDAGKLSIQVGANDHESISIGLRTIDAQSLGLSTFNVTGPIKLADGNTTANAAAADFQKHLASPQGLLQAPFPWAMAQLLPRPPLRQRHRARQRRALLRQPPQVLPRLVRRQLPPLAAPTPLPWLPVSVSPQTKSRLPLKPR